MNTRFLLVPFNFLSISKAKTSPHSTTHKSSPIFRVFLEANSVDRRQVVGRECILNFFLLWVKKGGVLKERRFSSLSSVLEDVVGDF